MVTHVRPPTTRAVDLKPEWHVIDANGKTLGRISTEIAVLLQGKHKPTYVPYLNTGDFVIVTNAEKVRVTGDKLKQKVYYRHSGYPGGLKEHTLARVLETDPTRAIKHAVKGMLPKSRLGRKMFSRLKVYVGGAHPHEAQVEGGRKAERARAAAEAATETADPADEQTQAATTVAAPEAKPKPRRTSRKKAADGAEAQAQPEAAMAAEAGTAESAPAAKKPSAKTGKRTGPKSGTSKTRSRASSSPKADAGDGAATETAEAGEEA